MMVRREQSQELLQKVKQEVVRSEMGGAGEMEELMFSRGLTWVAGWVVAGRSRGSLWDILHWRSGLGREVQDSREKAMQVLSVNDMIQESGQRQRREPRTEARDGIACHAGKNEERAKSGEKKQARKQAGPRGE